MNLDYMIQLLIIATYERLYCIPTIWYTIDATIFFSQMLYTTDKKETANISTKYETLKAKFQQ